MIAAHSENLPQVVRNMDHSYSICDNELRLSPLSKDELEKLRLLRNENRRFFFDAGEISRTEQETWYKSYLQTPQDYMFSAFYEDQWIGTVSIYHVNGEKAEFGRLLIDKRRAGRGGLGVSATRLACRIAFEQLGISELFLEVYCDNAAAQVTYLEAGFLPVEIFANEKKRTIMRMALQKKPVEWAGA